MPRGRKARRRSGDEFWNESVGGVPRWLVVVVGIPLIALAVVVFTLAFQRGDVEPTAEGLPPTTTTATAPETVEPTSTTAPTTAPEPGPASGSARVVAVVGDALTEPDPGTDEWSVRATKAVDAERETSIVAEAGFVVGVVPFTDSERLREVLRTDPAAVVIETSGVDAFSPPAEVTAAVRTVVQRLTKQDARVVIVGPIASPTATPELVALDATLDASAEKFGATHVSVLDWIDEEGMLAGDGVGLSREGDRRLGEQVAEALRGL